jgi:hypothetical protein
MDRFVIVDFDFPFLEPMLYDVEVVLNLFGRGYGILVKR